MMVYMTISCKGEIVANHRPVHYFYAGATHNTLEESTELFVL